MKKLEKLQIIFDHDHGPQNEGWYVRLQGIDFLCHLTQELDSVVYMDIRPSSDCGLSKHDQATLRAEARRVARGNGYRVASGFPVEIKQ
jgi:hypothetical protein